MIRVVLDTNIIVSALFWKGLPRIVFDAALDKRYFALTTDALTAELKRVLTYPKFAQQIANQALGTEQLVADYPMIAITVLPGDVPPDIVRDPKDREVLACALGGKADSIISGDKDLLVLGMYEGIPVVSPDQFLQRLPTE